MTSVAIREAGLSEPALPTRNSRLMVITVAAVDAAMLARLFPMRIAESAEVKFSLIL